jgi:hypothetical protein
VSVWWLTGPALSGSLIPVDDRAGSVAMRAISLQTRHYIRHEMARLYLPPQLYIYPHNYSLSNHIAFGLNAILMIESPLHRVVTRG